MKPFIFFYNLYFFGEHKKNNLKYINLNKSKLFNDRSRKINLENQANNNFNVRFHKTARPRPLARQLHPGHPKQPTAPAPAINPPDPPVAHLLPVRINRPAAHKAARVALPVAQGGSHGGGVGRGLRASRQTGRLAGGTRILEGAFFCGAGCWPLGCPGPRRGQGVQSRQQGQPVLFVIICESDG
jgi:hypothetical protein